jgi:hypothetical protein
MIDSSRTVVKNPTKYQGSVLGDEFMYVKIVALQSVILG